MSGSRREVELALNIATQNTSAVDDLRAELDKLKELGMQDGNTVRIGNFEFDYVF